MLRKRTVKIAQLGIVLINGQLRCIDGLLIDIGKRFVIRRIVRRIRKRSRQNMAENARSQRIKLIYQLQGFFVGDASVVLELRI
ncbi:hypothetical protein SDC9_144131 [bioreactor metagenome]|uniref:Uncharacterized protein n=1 Tax=bioreactor metagenome TaxID=1076179 RepID=A0A645E5W5_9ZZZZ